MIDLRADPPAAAMRYYYNIMMNTHASMGLRNSREAKTLCRALDLAADRRYGALADLLAQRLKSIEKAVADGNWNRAQWFELLPPEGTTMLERDEDYMVTREEQLERRLKGPAGGGEKGGKDNKGQKGKGKGKDKNK